MMKSLATALIFVALIGALFVWLWRQLKHAKATKDKAFPAAPDAASQLTHSSSAHLCETVDAQTDND